MGSAERTEDTVKDIRLDINPLKDETVLNEVMDAYARSRQSASHSVDRRESVMTWIRKRKKVAVAAVVLIAVVVGVHHFTGHLLVFVHYVLVFIGIKINAICYLVGYMSNVFFNVFHGYVCVAGNQK